VLFQGGPVDTVEIIVSGVFTVAGAFLGQFIAEWRSSGETTRDARPIIRQINVYQVSSDRRHATAINESTDDLVLVVVGSLFVVAALIWTLLSLRTELFWILSLSAGLVLGFALSRRDLLAEGHLVAVTATCALVAVVAALLVTMETPFGSMESVHAQMEVSGVWSVVLDKEGMGPYLFLRAIGVIFAITALLLAAWSLRRVPLGDSTSVLSVFVAITALVFSLGWVWSLLDGGAFDFVPTPPSTTVGGGP
jgi:uncharacterized protein YneF (UPF0154 family)